MSETRSTMIAGAARLLGANGYAGTSLNDVLELTGAPRGSIYHHFRGGKDELVIAALDLSESRARAALEKADPTRPVEVVDSFIDVWRQLLIWSDFSVGCSLVGVTVSAGSPDVVAVAGRIFGEWRSDLEAQFRRAGLEADAAGVAELLIAAAEGAVVVARARRSLAPLDEVAAQLRRYVELLGASAAD